MRPNVGLMWRCPIWQSNTSCVAVLPFILFTQSLSCVYTHCFPAVTLPRMWRIEYLLQCNYPKIREFGCYSYRASQWGHLTRWQVKGLYSPFFAIPSERRLLQSHKGCRFLFHVSDNTPGQVFILLSEQRRVKWKVQQSTGFKQQA